MLRTKFLFLIAGTVFQYENFDLTTVVTPVLPNKLKQLLIVAGYYSHKIDKLYQGFKNGFSLGYQGDPQAEIFSHNLPLRVGNITDLWNKVMKEVKLKRFTGPYKQVPFNKFIQSPIGLVPKDHGKDTRLIFHVSHPKGGTTSVNVNTLAEICKVKYQDFDQAIKLCLDLCANDNQPVFLSKSDVDIAFRNLGLAPASWPWTVLKAKSPLDGRYYFFVDKCLPFGSSISCALFQVVSDAVVFLVKHRTNRPLINYLDDYLFVALMRSVCNWQMQTFLQVCREINLPVSAKRTHWASEMLVFLGFLVDGKNKIVLIPIDKLHKANELISEFLQHKKKKVTVLKLQQLCGFLNFLCCCVVPGCTFTRCLYAPIKHNMKPHHHIKITGEMKLDLRMWQKFLAHPAVFCRPFADFSNTIVAEQVNFYTDSSGNFDLGCGGICDKDWFFIGWEKQFMQTKRPSIEYLELYAVIVGVVLWIGKFANHRICLFCNNQAVMAMINTKMSGCHNCMLLIRILVLQSLLHNVVVNACYVKSELNFLAEALSRRKFKLFRHWAGDDVNHLPCKIPEQLWPMNKLWMD